MGRQRESIGIDYGINDDGSILVRKGLSKPLLTSPGFDPDFFRTYRFGDFGKIGVLEIHAKRSYPALLLLDADEVQGIVIEDDLNHRNLSLHLRQRSPIPSIVKPPSPQRAIVCRPGYANCAPNALGAALAMEAHENEPKSLRFLPPLMCLASHITAVPVSAKNRRRQRQLRLVLRPGIPDVSA